ncbi:MAG TPA: asparaginase [Candidatus Wallbacteria bacterium]|nr:MAG: L-asparaginase 1 [bacterium ADurb.Bin243]HOD40386.1 asparaginase [Candidatus Wallbacteria bacterium]HPG56352.1 asparaginase [Candidatus Wallbacteria bacterium]
MKKPNTEKPNILLITTGGTITMVHDEKTGSLAPAKSSDELIMHFPEVKKIAHITKKELFNIDSTNIQLNHWQKIASAIFDSYDDYDGFVITHGTDTLAYTAAALSFMLQNLKKPVILTGSQMPLGEIGSDARNNFINSFIAATKDINEVAILFGEKIIRGTRAKKISAFHLNAFESVNEKPIGEVGLVIKLFEHRRMPCRKKLTVESNFNKNVFLLKMFPSISPRIFDKIIEMGYEGIVIEGFGAGNIPTNENSILPGIERAIARNIAVVIGTQCLLGEVDLNLYEVGMKAAKIGAIAAFDMTLETTLCKLMYALGKSGDLKEIKKIMKTDICGEIKMPSR